jgi:hypothetical protein
VPEFDDEDVAAFYAAYEESLDKRGAIFHVTGFDEPIDLEDLVMVHAVLDRLAEESGHAPLGTAWTPILEPQAVQALDVLVCFDQAYHCRSVGDKAAALLVGEFVALFPEPRSWYSNAVFAERPSRIDRDGELVTVPLLVPTGWYGMLTGATFDTGLAVLSSRRTGLLWFADED